MTVSAGSNLFQKMSSRVSLCFFKRKLRSSVISSGICLPSPLGQEQHGSEHVVKKSGFGLEICYQIFIIDGVAVLSPRLPQEEQSTMIFSLNRTGNIDHLSSVLSKRVRVFRELHLLQRNERSWILVNILEC